MRDKPFVRGSGRWMMGLAIAAALGVAGMGFFIYTIVRSSNTAATDLAAQEDTLAVQPREAITALGRIEPQGGIIQVAAPSNGSRRLSQLLVQLGDRVEEGQPLALMDNADRLQAGVIQAQAQVIEAEQRLAQVRAGTKSADIEAQRAAVNRLQAELQVAQREYARYRSLYEDGAISASVLDDRQLVLARTAQQLEEARQQLSSLQQVPGVDIQLAESQVQVALANLQQAQTVLQDAIVRSPTSGQIIKIHANPGEEVGNTGILEMGNTNQMYVVAEVYETDIRLIRTGQPVVVTSDAFTEEVIGTVERVGLLIDKNDVLDVDPTASVDARVVEVQIKLQDSEQVSGLTNLQVRVAIAI